jgi:type II secretory pathway component GspD/PulD (secretin)
MGIKQRVRLKLSTNAGSPAVCGLWRPVILIPQALAEKLTPVQLRAVLFHELAHIQRGDVWVNVAQTLLQIFYWWHPLLWLANAQTRRVREQAVDERVMVEMGREAEAYPATLLEVAKLASRRPLTALGLIGIVESKSALAQRIRHLLDTPAPRSAKLGFARLAAIVLVGAVLLPMARGQRRQASQADAPAAQPLSQTAAIEVEVRFASLTDASLENLLGFRPKTIAATGHFVWTLSPADRVELLQRMERQPGVAIRSAPRVTTTNARQAQMAVDGIEPFLHPRAHTSAAFQIIPYQIGGSLDLVVSAKITESGDVGSVFGADSSLNPKEETNVASPRATSNQVYAVNAVGYINYDVGTAQALVRDGGSVILQNPTLTGADGRRILVVVSPRIVRQSASASAPSPKAVSFAGSPHSAAPPREETKQLPTPATISAQDQRADEAAGDSSRETESLIAVWERYLKPKPLTVTIAKAEPYLYLDSKPVNVEYLKAEFERLAKRDAAGVVSIRAEHGAPTSELVKVAAAARKAGLSKIYLTSPQTNAPSVLETSPSERSGKPRPSDAAASDSVPLLGDVPFWEGLSWQDTNNINAQREISDTQPHGTRIFKLDPKTFFEDAHRFLLEAGWSDLEIFGHTNDWKLSIVRKFCESLGVSRAPSNTVFYTFGTGMLTVRANAEELDRVQKAIETFNALRQKESASQTPTTSPKLGDERVSQPKAPEELVVSKKSSETIKLETRVFSVSPATLLEGLKNTSGVPPNPGTIDSIDSIQDSLRALLTAAGVNVQPPNAVFFNHRTGVLMVRATSTELDIVQKALEMLNYRPPQLTIEAKFMELPTEAVRQLGFDLPPPDLASNTWTRILTAAQTRAVLHAAGQFAGVDILSAPRITTLSGRQSQIQAVDIRTVVTGIDPKALTPPGVQSTNGVPAQPYFTSQVSSGPTLDVVPSVGADGYTIHLAALPQVTEFLRYDTTLNGAKETRVWVDGRQQQVPLPRPITCHRSMHAAVDIYDGQTLVLANPQVTIVSEQPSGESVTNAVPEDAGKRLLVLITPRIIDPAGNPIHVSGKEPFPTDKPPPQQVR